MPGLPSRSWTKKMQKKLSDYLKKFNKKVNFMEVCGTHTVAISKSGIRSLLPKNIRLLSGPGCPVCVTPQSDIDSAIEIAKKKNVIFTTFGDMLRVPSNSSSLEKELSKGADIRIVYSPADALETAKTNPSKEVVFMGVGFETTSPLIAATILQAKKEIIKNFSIVSAFKLIPPALKALLSDKSIKIDGFILPGHVSTIIGSKPYEFINIPCVISGFEGEEILESIEMLLKQIENGAPKVEIQYKKAVKAEGNPDAVNILYKVFEPCDSVWRGIGMIPDSGLKLREEFKEFDAARKFNIKISKTEEPKGCSCGDILKGKKIPTDCKLFKKACTPINPIGPCMVSSEGACQAYYRYEQN